MAMKRMVGLSVTAVVSHGIYVSYNRQSKKDIHFASGGADEMLMSRLQPGDIILFERNILSYWVRVYSVFDDMMH